MEPARVVRIATPRPPAAELAPEVEAAGSPSEPAGSDVRVNRSGTQRAMRTYLAFLIALLAIYLTFLLSLSTAQYPGVRSNWTGYGLLSLALASIGLYGYGITVLRAPRDLRTEATEIVVRERTGRVQRFPTGPGFNVSVLKRYPSGPFSEEPTEVVRVSVPSGTARTYLVEHGFFPEAPAAAPG